MDKFFEILGGASIFYAVISFVFPIAVLMFLWTINKRLEMIESIMLNKHKKEEKKDESDDIQYLR